MLRVIDPDPVLVAAFIAYALWAAIIFYRQERRAGQLRQAYEQKAAELRAVTATRDYFRRRLRDQCGADDCYQDEGA